MDKYIKLGPAEEKQGGRHRESNLACSLEAILGAYYLCGKVTEIENFIDKYLSPYIQDIDEHKVELINKHISPIKDEYIELFKNNLPSSKRRFNSTNT